MRDPRVKKLAEILVNHSIRVQPEEKIIIKSSELGRPLVEEVYKLILLKGAFPICSLSFNSLSQIYYKYAASKHLSSMDEIFYHTLKNCQGLITVSAPSNQKALSSVDPEKIAAQSKTNTPIHDYIMEDRIKWVITNFPTEALAQEAEMSLEEYSDYLFGATNIDWKDQSRYQDKIKEVFDTGNMIDIKGPATHITFSIEGRKGTKCCGQSNMPDGEVYYSPVEDSVEGYITYDFPAIFRGREVNGVYLEFSNGKVVKSRAEKNQDFLDMMLKIDEGARFIGEFGIGTNPGINRLIKDILFDEKIGGTIHLALGQSYPDSGGKNKSSIHWDMIKDLRKDGELYVDGKLVQKNGEFLI